MCVRVEESLLKGYIRARVLNIIVGYVFAVKSFCVYDSGLFYCGMQRSTIDVQKDDRNRFHTYNNCIVIENEKNTSHNDLYILQNALQKRALSTRRDLLNVYYYRMPNNIIGYRMNVGFP